MCPFRRLKQSAKSNFLLLRTSGRDTGNEHTSFQTQSAGIQGSYSHAGKGKNGSSHSSHRHREIPDRIQAGRRKSIKTFSVAVTK